MLVFVDAWTAYGGSQFVDSRGTGRYHSYLCEEVVPFVDARYRMLPERAPAGHGGIDDRYPLALAWLCHRITDQPA